MTVFCRRIIPAAWWKPAVREQRLARMGLERRNRTVEREFLGRELWAGIQHRRHEGGKEEAGCDIRSLGREAPRSDLLRE